MDFVLIPGSTASIFAAGAARQKPLTEGFALHQLVMEQNNWNSARSKMGPNRRSYYCRYLVYTFAAPLEINELLKLHINLSLGIFFSFFLFSKTGKCIGSPQALSRHLKSCAQTQNNYH